MKKDLFIEKSFIYPQKSESIGMPENYIYKENLGYWVNKFNNSPMMLDPNWPRPRTKKEDIETGEDRKGE